METTLLHVMRLTRNYFVREKREGAFTLKGNILSPAPRAPYVFIQGSMAADGLHIHQAGYLGDPCEDERFTGTVYALNPPKDFLQLCREVAEYQKHFPAGSPKAETFGDYRYEKGKETWMEVFAPRLMMYRKMFPEVKNG